MCVAVPLVISVLKFAWDGTLELRESAFGDRLFASQ